MVMRGRTPRRRPQRASGARPACLASHAAASRTKYIRPVSCRQQQRHRNYGSLPGTGDPGHDRARKTSEPVVCRAAVASCPPLKLNASGVDIPTRSPWLKTRRRRSLKPRVNARYARLPDEAGNQADGRLDAMDRVARVLWSTGEPLKDAVAAAFTALRCEVEAAAAPGGPLVARLGDSRRMLVVVAGAAGPIPKSDESLARAFAAIQSAGTGDRVVFVATSDPASPPAGRPDPLSPTRWRSSSGRRDRGGRRAFSSGGWRRIAERRQGLERLHAQRAARSRSRRADPPGRSIHSVPRRARRGPRERPRRAGRRAPPRHAAARRRPAAAAGSLPGASEPAVTQERVAGPPVVACPRSDSRRPRRHAPAPLPETVQHTHPLVQRQRHRDGAVDARPAGRRSRGGHRGVVALHRPAEPGSDRLGLRQRRGLDAPRTPTRSS